MQLYSPPSFPEFPTGSDRDNLTKRVEIYHPGYPRSPPLISLRTSDEGAVYYDVAYYACCIVAGNTWTASEGRDQSEDEPFLSASSDPSQPRLIIHDDLVPKGIYYFHIPNYSKDNPYPIVPNFDHWVFPHNRLPKPWQALAPSPVEESFDRNPPSALDIRLAPCRMTASLTTLELAHMLPRTIRSWFHSNRMRQYPSSLKRSDAIDDDTNIIPLRPDVHRLFDRNHLVVIPKRDRDGTYKLVTHVLHPPGKSQDSDIEIITRYQNRQWLPLDNIPIEYVFARFAWSLFTKATIVLFDQSEQLYSVLLVENPDHDEPKPDVKVLSLRDLPQPRSAASNRKSGGAKRSRTEADEDNEHWVYSVRTGEMVYVDDETASVDSAFYDNAFDYDSSDGYESDSSRPCKKSRSMSSSPGRRYNEPVPDLSLSVHSVGSSSKSITHPDKQDVVSVVRNVGKAEGKTEVFDNPAEVSPVHRH